MLAKLILTIFLVNLSLVYSNWDCTYLQAASEFKKKVLTNPRPSFPNDPYKNQTEESMKQIAQTLQNEDLVCAIKYKDANKIEYDIRQFDNKQQAEQNHYIVTHQGICGACSTLQDLSVYLSMNLTKPVRQCGMKGAIIKSWAYDCIKDLGFTDQCTQIWAYNAANTQRECFLVCMISWMKDEPFNKPDGSLNDCLQCDEDKSGPVFKYYSGRSRRNSGIISDIQRPGEQVYDIAQCYF